MHSLQQFFHMGGYGLYVWGSYGCVFAFLGSQWFISWRRWKLYMKQHHE